MLLLKCSSRTALLTEKDCLYNLYKTALTDLIEHTSIYANDQQQVF